MFTFDVKTINEYSREITGEISQEVVTKHVEKVCHELKRDMIMPGFRRGKVPLGMLRKRFAKEIKAQVLEELFSENYPKIIEQTKLHPIEQPDIQELDYEEGKPARFKFSVEVIVMDEPTDYRGVKIRVEKAAVTEEDVTTYLKSLMYRHGEIRVVEDRAITKEDLVIIDVKAFDGETPIETLQREKSQIQIGRNNIISDPRFDDALIGLKQGDSKTFTLEFGSDVESVPLRDKKVVFEVEIYEVKEIVLPELNDEFAKSLGHFTSLDDLKENITKSLQEDKNDRSRKNAITSLLDQIIEKNEIKFPPRLVEDYMKEMVSNYTEQTGIEIGPDEMQDKFEKQAIRELKRMFLLSRIAEKEKIEVTDEEVTKVMDTFNMFYQQSPKREQAGKKGQIMNTLKENKTIDFLYEQADKEIIGPDGQVEPPAVDVDTASESSADSTSTEK